MGTQRLRHPELYLDPVYLDLIARLAANTRRLRAERNWTQEEAAEHCNVATVVFQTVEGGRKNFTGTVVARLCKGFGVDVRELFEPAPPLARKKPGRPSKTLSRKAQSVLVSEVSAGEALSEPGRPALLNLSEPSLASDEAKNNDALSGATRAEESGDRPTG